MPQPCCAGHQSSNQRRQPHLTATCNLRASARCKPITVQDANGQRSVRSRRGSRRPATSPPSPRADTDFFTGRFKEADAAPVDLGQVDARNPSFACTADELLDADARTMLLQKISVHTGRSQISRVHQLLATHESSAPDSRFVVVILLCSIHCSGSIFLFNQLRRFGFEARRHAREFAQLHMHAHYY